MFSYWIRFALSLGLLRAAFPSQAQVTTPLHTFFQQNFDSTIVYQSSSVWNESASYLILAIHHSRLAFFTYRSPYRNILGHYFPGQLVQKFSKEEARFRATTPDTNRYLLPQPIASDSLRYSWQSLKPVLLWSVQSDEQARRVLGKCVVEDGEDVTLWFIDKKSIRSARFYAPVFFEACAGKDAGRQQAIRVTNTLQRLLRQGR
ncbi:hypothetical protein H8B15_03220 [Hymenobacter sp. BT507]|uniref:GLPGLI family protein n=1 Tax=Hymenobacter citatus TaxID=2763506 RepID=A0ABR7MFR6_9BACT|nr:hypothetical protein [Hymenobacter citatus]MBC6609917.1 hypothetical protein [Hymenobacter citatus]